MSTRTIIEINHDYLTVNTLTALVDLFNLLGTSEATRLLNENDGVPVFWRGCGIRILGQRHHSETLKLEVK
jgi:hypothetical protein